MRFIDEATIKVVAGHGGPGIVSFRRESHVARGGPDGGDGGRGADVVAWADPGTTTLLDHRYRHIYTAESGASGGPAGRTGRSATELVLPLPTGTVITDAETGEILADLVEPDQRIVVARGGRGGQGNARFSTPTRRAPRFAQDGEEGESRKLELSLKLMADIGLVGLPNAGKSTFIRKVTRSQARVADYPFTTLVPNLGVARVDERTVVVADIPGLIEGAHVGQGLGDRFLKHVERTRVLIHLLSLSPDSMDPLDAFRTVNQELEAHAEELAQRPQVVVLNKVDLVEDRDEIPLWEEAFRELGVEIITTSALTGEGTLMVLRRAIDLMVSEEPGESGPEEPWSSL